MEANIQLAIIYYIIIFIEPWLFYFPKHVPEGWGMYYHSGTSKNEIWLEKDQLKVLKKIEEVLNQKPL